MAEHGFKIEIAFVGRLATIAIAGCFAELCIVPSDTKAFTHSHPQLEVKSLYVGEIFLGDVPLTKKIFCWAKQLVGHPWMFELVGLTDAV